MNETIKYIIIWLSIFIVGSLIVSFLIYPNSFQSFKSNIKDILPSTSSNLNNPSSNPQVQNPSLTSCQAEIKEKTRIAEEKSMLNLDISVREYKEFNNTYSAVQYLKDWGLIGNGLTGVNMYPDLFESNYGSNLYFIDLSKEEDKQYIIQYDNIIVFLTRFEYSNNGDNAKILKPIICVDGKLTEQSIFRFNTF